MFLKSINLSRNHIQTIDLTPLSTCLNLEELHLEYNKIKHVDLNPLESCNHLRIIDISNNEPLNKIDLSPLSKCKSLQSLYLNDNSITEFDFTPLTTCQELNNISLSSNSAKRIMLAEIPSLQKLGLSSNNLDQIDLNPLSSCKDLIQIHLDGNPLVSIDISPLLACIKLGKLYLPEETTIRLDAESLEGMMLPLAIYDLIEAGRVEGDLSQVQSPWPNLRGDLKLREQMEGWVHEIMYVHWLDTDIILAELGSSKLAVASISRGEVIKQLPSKTYSEVAGSSTIIALSGEEETSEDEDEENSSQIKPRKLLESFALPSCTLIAQLELDTDLDEFPVAVSLDGSLIACAIHNEVIVHRSDNLESIIRLKHPEGVYIDAVKFSPDDNFLIVEDNDGEVIVYRKDDGQILWYSARLYEDEEDLCGLFHSVDYFHTHLWIIFTYDILSNK